jgi:hypothetical protein
VSHFSDHDYIQFCTIIASHLKWKSLKPSQVTAVTEIIFKRRSGYMGAPTDWGKSVIPVAAAICGNLGLAGLRNERSLFLVPTHAVAMNMAESVQGLSFTTCHPGVGSHSKMSTLEAIKNQPDLCIMCYARFISMLGFNTTDGTKLDTGKSIKLKKAATKYFSHAYIAVDEVHLLVMWNKYPACSLLASILDASLPYAVKYFMTATSIFSEARKTQYLQRSLRLPKNHFYFIDSTIRPDVQKIIVNVDVILDKKSAESCDKRISLYIMDEVRKLHIFAKSSGVILMVVFPNPGMCIKFRQNYVIKYRLDRDAIPLVLGTKDQSTEQRSESFAIIGGGECSIFIGSPAVLQGVTLRKVCIGVQICQPYGGYSEHQASGRIHRTNCFPPHFPYGYSIVFISSSDMWSDDRRLCGNEEEGRQVEIAGRMIMRDMASSSQCAQLHGIQHRQPIMTTDTELGPCRICLACCNGSVDVNVSNDAHAVFLAVIESRGLLNPKRLANLLVGDRQLLKQCEAYESCYDRSMTSFVTYGFLKCASVGVVYILILKLLRGGMLTEIYRVVTESQSLKASNPRPCVQLSSSNKAMTGIQKNMCVPCIPHTKDGSVVSQNLVSLDSQGKLLLPPALSSCHGSHSEPAVTSAHPNAADDPPPSQKHDDGDNAHSASPTTEKYAPLPAAQESVAGPRAAAGNCLHQSNACMVDLDTDTDIDMGCSSTSPLPGAVSTEEIGKIKCCV